MSNNTVHIKPSQRGSFTKWAKEHNMSVGQATQTVLAHKDRYSSAIVKKANFSRNFGGNKYGGDIGNPILMGYMAGGGPLNYVNKNSMRNPGLDPTYSKILHESDPGDVFYKARISQPTPDTPNSRYFKVSMKYQDKMKEYSPDLPISSNEYFTIQDLSGDKPGIRNGTKINKGILTQLAIAAAKEGVSLDDALTTAMRESGIGHVDGATKTKYNPKNIMRGWDAYTTKDFPDSLTQYMIHNNLVPKSAIRKGTHGYSADLNFENPGFKSYLSDYEKYLDGFKVDPTLNEPFRAEMRFLKSNSGQKYNPKEKDRLAKLQYDLNVIKNNKEFYMYAQDAYNNAKKFGGYINPQRHTWMKDNPNDTGVLEKRMGGFITGRTQMNNTPRDMYALGGQMDINNFGRTYGKDMLVGGATGLASSVGGNAGDAAYNTTMGVVGSAGPVGAAIGTITGIGDSIGNPIRQKNESIGQYGGLQHMGAAERSANLGASLNPLKAITMTLGDKEASSREKWTAGINTALPGMGAVLGFGKARSQRLNDQSKSAFNKQLTLNANNELNMMYGYMALGGDTSKYAGNRGGMDVYPYSKNIVDYKGATHENGGIKVDSNGNPTAKTGRQAVAEVEGGELNWNDYVFSNTIVYGKKR